MDVAAASLKPVLDPGLASADFLARVPREFARQHGILSQGVRDGREVLVVAPGANRDALWNVAVELERPTVMEEADPAALQQAIDDAVSGFLNAITDARTNSTTLVHDAAGRLVSTTTPGGVLTQQAYNGVGWLVSRTDGAGQITRFGYDPCGRQARTTNPLGGWSGTSYDPAGNVVATMAAEGLPQLALIDQDGEPEGSVDRFGVVTFTAITGSGGSAMRVTSRSDSAASSQLVYGANALPAISTTLDGASGSFTTTLTLRDDGSTQAVTPPGRAQVSNQVDGFGRERIANVPLVIDGGQQQRQSTTGFDANGLPTGSTAPFGLATQPEIDAVTGEQNGARSNAVAAIPTQTDPTTRVLSRDADGHVLSFGAFANHETTPSLLTTQTFDGDGRLLTRTGPDLVTTTYHYDSAGRLQDVVRGTQTTTYGYDALGNVTSVDDHAGVHQVSVFDRLGRLVSRTVGTDTTTYAYDPDTLVLRVEHGPGGRTTFTDYDSSGRMAQVTDPSGRTMGFRYDALGRRSQVTFGDGSKETMSYDADRTDVATVTDRAGRLITNTYDITGRLAQRAINDHGTVTTVGYALATPTQGAASGIVETSTVNGQTIARHQDRAGRPSELTLPGQPTLAMAYDVAGRLIQKGDTAYAFDLVTGQLTTLGAPDTGSVAMTYDPNGRLASETLPNGVIRTYGYDAAGRIAQVTQTIGAASETWTYTRDDQGRIIRVDAPGHVDTYVYEAGRLARENRTGDGARQNLYALDGSDNRIAQAVYQPPVAHGESFAGASVPATVQPTAGTWAVDSGALTASATGTATASLALVSGADHLCADIGVSVLPSIPTSGSTLAAIGVAATGGAQYRLGWQVRPYPDATFTSPPGQGRLVIQKIDGTGTSDLAASDWVDETGAAAHQLLVTQWPDDRLTVVSGGVTVSAPTPGVGRLTVDGAWSLIAAADTAGGTAAARFDDLAWASTTTRTGEGSVYDGLNRLIAHDESGTAGVASETYGYDPVGNLTSRVRTGDGANAWAYGYDGLDRQTTATVGGVTSSYAYFADSWMRATATVGGVATSFAWDGSDLLSRTVGGLTTKYLGYAGRPLVEATGGVRTTYGRDGLGNVTGLIAQVATGPIPGNFEYTRKFDYDAFGNTTETVRQWDGATLAYVPANATDGPHYRGEWNDAATAQGYNRHRYYIPALGRFGAVDPARAGGNWYAYCGGDPVNREDPYGLDYIDYEDNVVKWFVEQEQPGALYGTNLVVVDKIALGVLGSDGSFRYKDRSYYLADVRGASGEFVNTGGWKTRTRRNAIATSLRSKIGGALTGGDGLATSEDAFEAELELPRAAAQAGSDATGGALLAYTQDNTNFVGQIGTSPGGPGTSAAEKIGAAVGHTAAGIQGLTEAVFGGTAVVAGTTEAVVASPTVVGALPGVATAAGGAALAAHGVSTGLNAASRLADLMSGDSAGSSGASAPTTGSRPPSFTPEGAGRRGAFNEAKRRNGVPTSQQPSRVTKNLDRNGRVQPGRTYEFDIPKEGGGTRKVIIRDDAAGHDYGTGDPQNRGPHFNDEAGNHYDYGE